VALAVAGQVAGEGQVAGAVGQGGEQGREPVGVAGGQVARGLGVVEKTTLTALDLGTDRAAGLRQLVRHIAGLAELGIGHVILVGPQFEGR